MPRAEGGPGTVRSHRTADPPGRSLGAVAAAAVLVAALSAGAYPGGLSAQEPRIVDSGTFEWRRDGRTVGTETFELRRSGRELRAVGRISLDTAVPGLRPLEVWLETDADYVPGLFRLRPSSGDVKSITGVREEKRFRLQISSGAGDRWKEFVSAPELSLVEPGIAHHWLVILRQHGAALERSGSVEVPAVVPSEARRASLRLRREGTGSVEVPGENRSAVRYTASLDGGPELRVWATEEGRVLRVEIASRNLTAVRLPGS